MRSNAEGFCRTISRSASLSSLSSPMARIKDRLRFMANDSGYYPGLVTGPTEFLASVARKATQEIDSNRSVRECRMVRAAAIDVYIELTSMADGEHLMITLGM